MLQVVSLIVGIALMVLQYHMLSHLVTESTLLRESKKSWVIAFVIIPLLSSVIYYFREYRRY